MGGQEETGHWAWRVKSVFSSVCDSTSTRPAPVIGLTAIVLEPALYSNSCSGEECTWISPGASAVTSSSICCPTATLISSPFGVTESPLKRDVDDLGRPGPDAVPRLEPLPHPARRAAASRAEAVAAACDRRHRIKSGQRRAQAAQSCPAPERRVHRRIGSLRRHARRNPDRLRVEDDLLSTGEATEATGAKGTRFSFRTGTDTYSIAAASLPWCVENFGKKWTIIYADYAWGQSTNQESKHYIEKSGGKVLSSIPIPLDAKDFVPYLSQIPGDSEVLLPAFIGSLSVAFYTQAKNMGLDKKMKMYSSSASIESIAPDDIQGAAEGVYFFENFPRMLKAKDDEFHREFIKRMGIDEVHAREVGGTRVMDKSHGWQSWEDIFAIKQAIEASGYKTRKDVEGVIQALEGMQMKNSLGASAGRQDYPQGRSRRHHRLLHQPCRKRQA